MCMRALNAFCSVASQRSALHAQTDHRLAALVARAREAARRRSFFLAFSSSPVDFINAQVAPVCLLSVKHILLM